MNRPANKSRSNPRAERQVSAYPSVSQQTRFRCSQILLIDDDPMQRMLMGRMLEKLGCFVEQRSSAVGVADHIAADPTRYDLIVCDFEMPDGDGLTLARALRQLPVRPPFMLCTGAAVLPADAWAVTEGVLAKPYRRDQLEAMYERCLLTGMLETETA